MPAVDLRSQDLRCKVISMSLGYREYAVYVSGNGQLLPFNATSGKIGRKPIRLVSGPKNQEPAPILQVGNPLYQLARGFIPFISWGQYRKFIGNIFGIKVLTLEKARARTGQQPAFAPPS
jgi:hypothetical protein